MDDFKTVSDCAEKWTYLSYLLGLLLFKNLHPCPKLLPNHKFRQLASTAIHHRRRDDRRNSRKRKRSESNKEQEAHIPSHLDYFKRDSEDGAPVTKAATAETNNNEKSRTEDEPQEIEGIASSLAKEDCKRILKRHKLEVALLNIK